MEPTPAASPPPRKPRRRNADYRWTVPKVTAFLEALSQSGRVADAARAVGMSRQSAYRLRARLGDAKFAAAFEGARRMGIRARAAASIARARSPWDGPLIGTRFRAPQGDTGAGQGDTRPAQGDAGSPHGDAARRQGDACRHKATEKISWTV